MWSWFWGFKEAWFLADMFRKDSPNLTGLTRECPRRIQDYKEKSTPIFQHCFEKGKTTNKALVPWNSAKESSEILRKSPLDYRLSLLGGFCCMKPLKISQGGEKEIERKFLERAIKQYRWILVVKKVEKTTGKLEVKNFHCGKTKFLICPRRS